MFGVVARALAVLSTTACLTAGPPAPFAWRNVNIQGMGYVTGMVINPLPPYDLFIRTDVGGVYRYDRAAQHWIPLLDNVPMTASSASNVESIAVDPTDPNTVYFAAGSTRVVDASGNVSYPGEVYVSHSRGSNWKALGLAAQNIYVGGNDEYRGTTGERLAVDPLQPSTMYFGTRRNGLWRGVIAADGSVTWTQVSGLPAATPASDGTTVGISFVVLDAHDLYVGVFGSGVWRSPDRGASWTNTGSANGPVSYGGSPLRAAVDHNDGTLYATFGDGEGSTYGDVGRYSGGAWQSIVPPDPAANPVAQGYSGISVDPWTQGTVAVARGVGGEVYRSTDRGTHWTAVLSAGAAVANQPAYYARGPTNYNAALRIDPANSKRVWATNGYGVIATDDVTAAAPQWSWRMNNLEELCVQKVKVPPVPGGADLFSVVDDMVGFRHASRDTVPTSSIASFLYVAQGDGFAYSAGQPQFAAFVGWDETNASNPMTGFTSDNGETWTPLANTSPGSGGKIAMSASDPNNLVWSPAGAPPQYSKDGGKTWQHCLTGGVPMTGSWQLSNAWWSPDVLAADMVNGGTFYYYDNGNFYASSDGGATWTLTNSTWPVNPQWCINAGIAVNPVKAGDIWMSFKPNDNQTNLFPLVHSTDGGHTFQAVPTVQSCNYVAFGKGAAADTPFLYIHGRANGDTEDAIYKSEDTAATWTRVTEPRTQQYGAITSLEGDMRTQDLVYAGLGCRGVVYGFGPKSGLPGATMQPNTPANRFGGQPGVVAPNELIALQPSIPPSAKITADRATILPDLLGGYQLLFDGQPTPLLEVSPNEVVAVVPSLVNGQTSVDLQESYPGAPVLTQPLSLTVVPAAPSIAAFGESWAINSDRSYNSASHPAARGSSITFYVTGAGALNESLPDGLIARNSAAPALPVQVQFGSVPATAATARVAPGSVTAVIEVRAVVPKNSPTGNAVPVSISFGSYATAPGPSVAIR